MMRLSIICRWLAAAAAAVCGILLLALAVIFASSLDGDGWLGGGITLAASALAGGYAYWRGRSARLLAQGRLAPSGKRMAWVAAADLAVFCAAMLLAGMVYFVIVSAGKKSTEGGNRGDLGYLRSAVSIYSGDTEGIYPADLAALTRDGKYLAGIPLLWRGSPFYSPHWQSRKVEYYPRKGTQDSGHWAYVNDSKSPDFGTVFIDCTHTDTLGARWDSF